MDTYWVRGVNSSGEFGSWAFAEFRDECESETDFVGDWLRRPVESW